MIQLFGILFLLKQCLFEIHLAPCITHNSALISPPCAALYGEALAALLVVQLTLSLHATSFILEGDSITVTLTLQYPKITQDWCIASIISHVHTIIPPTTSWPANHVNRSASFYAHHVVSRAATRLHYGCILILPSLTGSSPTCFGRAPSSSFLVS
jgi:hypothetical protein